MIRRNAERLVRRAAKHYPVVTITGPRQSGKTTLCRSVFPRKPYLSLEPLDAREAARADPRGLLARYPGGAVLDEVQHVPEVLSYLQGLVDEDARHGRFILTGSQHFGLGRAIAQTLAGRTAVVHLLPLALDEVRRFPDPPRELFATLVQGGFPRIPDRRVPPAQWLGDYVTTYVQRDVRELTNVGDLRAFTGFLRLCAGRVAQELNLSALAADAGVSQPTAKAWLSVLEASYIVFLVPPWHRNLNKRLVKRPKLHFVDSGLACHLLGIREPEQLHAHPLRGAIFESWVAAEIYKAHANAGRSLDLFHFRESRGLEVDLVLEAGDTLIAVEVKSGATVASDFTAPLEAFAALVAGSGEHRAVERRLVHGGDAHHSQRGTRLVPWHRIAVDTWTSP